MQEIVASAGLHYASTADLDSLLEECRGRVLGLVGFGGPVPGRKDIVSTTVDPGGANLTTTNTYSTNGLLVTSVRSDGSWVFRTSPGHLADHKCCVAASLLWRG